MKTRALGNTGLQLPILSFGASSLGAEFRGIDFDGPHGLSLRVHHLQADRRCWFGRHGFTLSI